jgi:glycerol uptake facilitator protein
MNPFYGEILGTALLVLFGDGTVANVVLAKSKAQNAGWIVVAISGKFPWSQTVDPDAKRAIFCTAPAIRRPLANLLCEVIGTLALMLGIFGIKGAVMQQGTGAAVPLDMGALGMIPVAFLVWGIGLALGGPTGYAKG